jgi:dTDP-4-dehydrorhamnose 3,5-epimerase
MHVESTTLVGVHRIYTQRRSDPRGWLIKTYDRECFAAAGLPATWEQALSTRTTLRGTVRGMHWQAAPQPETKLVRCTRGTIWDCVVCVDPLAPQFGHWEGFELSEATLDSLYIPPGYAHGFQAITDDAEVSYLIAGLYVPELQRGLRWSCKQVGITWPLPVTGFSDRDAGFPGLEELGKRNTLD